MKDSWICRDYQNGDEYQILTLYKEVNNREMDLGYWRWRFAESPYGKGIMKLMLDEGKLIGHYAIVPVDLQIGNRVVKDAFSLNTMTHPDHEGQGIFTYLAKQAYEVCRQEGFGLVYGFPNGNSYYGFTRKLGWTGFGRIFTWQKNLRNSTGTIPNDVSIRETDRFDASIDLLWDKVKGDYKVIVPRTQSYLNWRFVEYPTRIYSRHIVIDNNDTALGYIVLKTYTGDSKPKGHIVDMLCIQDKSIVRSLLNHAYGYFTKRQIQDLSCWMPDNCAYAQVLGDEGFVKSESTTNFGVLVFNRLAQDAERPDNWYLTMGDSDVF